MRTDPRRERGVILDHPVKRPYGARVRIHLQTPGALGGAEHVSVPMESGPILLIEPARKAPWEAGVKYAATLEAFPTAAAAEAAGRRLVQALLWMAISTDAPLRLDYLTYEPATVFDRNRSSGDTCQAYGEVSFSPLRVLGELRDAYSDLPTPNDKLLLSMEIFCAARLESSQRATFLALVSALEPLAEQRQLGDEVNTFVERCVQQLRADGSIPGGLRSSIEGRLLQLRHESIRQALRRLASAVLPEQPDKARVVDEAYSLRSQIVHDGLPADLDVDLEYEAATISQVIRELYSSMLGRTLARCR